MKEADVQFQYNGKKYSFDLNDELPVAEARLIKQHTGMTLSQFFAGIQDGDVDSIVGIVFLAVRRAGDPIEWSDLDDMDLMKMATDIAEINNLDMDAVAAGGMGAVQEQLNRAQRRTNAKKPAMKA